MEIPDGASDVGNCRSCLPCRWAWKVKVGFQVRMWDKYMDEFAIDKEYVIKHGGTSIRVS